MKDSTPKYWLIKAEPDSRVVKAIDVKFSIDDFEAVGSTPWEGVRNYEARNLMKEMAVGDQVLFYHSNCKNPGIAGFAEVSMEAYPDYTAWDSAHPYFDERSDESEPTWFMVDVKFVSRARHFVPLSLFRYLASLSSPELPEGVNYVGEDDINAIKAMPLVTRGRLSVQRVSEKCWDVVRTLADKGGWDDVPFEKKKATKTRPTFSHQTSKRTTIQHDRSEVVVGDDHDCKSQPKEQTPHQENINKGRKRNAPSEDEGTTPRRKSLRRCKGRSA